MKKIIGIFFAFAVLGMLLFTACKKKAKWQYDNSNAPATSATVENAYSEMPNISNQAISGAMVYYKSPTVTVNYNSAAESMKAGLEKAACSVIITIDTVGTADTLIVDWGTSNCECNDGKQRRGKIITTWTGSYYSQGSIIKHVPQDYYVNDNKVEGTMTVENMGNNSQTQPYYNININGVVTMSTGEIVNYTSTRVRTFTAGYTTLLWFMDDEYDITGTASATAVNGDGWDATVTSPLHVKVGCPYVTKGVLNFTPTGKDLRVIDYGDGTCDAKFVVTINGNSYTIN